MKEIKRNSLQAWILAARPKTLTGAVTPVLIGTALAAMDGHFEWLPALICCVFASLMQIAANFINDLFDFLKGTDREDRLGPERACAQGWISLQAMKTGIIVTVTLACLIGCTLLFYAGWELIIVGVLCVLFAFLYTTGPYPLSYHGLGDIAVFIFFGLIAVNLSFYVQSLYFERQVFLCSIAMGLLSVNILMVNNYRDKETDETSNKKTLVVLFGHKFAEYAYLLNGIAALAVTGTIWFTTSITGYIAAILYLSIHLKTWYAMTKKKGTELNPILGKTARNQLIFTLLLILILIITRSASF